MAKHLTPQQVLILLGTALVISGVLVLTIYFLHRALRKERKTRNLKATSPRSGDESAFLIASMQGVLSRMKARETELEGMLREAEQGAVTNSRTVEAIVRDLPQALLVFDQAGFLKLANPAARVLLETDTWARRRYLEILTPGSELSLRVRNCLEGGKACRWEKVIHPLLSGGERQLQVSISPLYGRDGQTAGAVCILAALKDRNAQKIPLRSEVNWYCGQ